MSLEDWINDLPEKDRDLARETISQLWDIFTELYKQGYLRENLESEERKVFIEILKTSNRLFDTFNMLFGISDFQGKFIRGRNKEFVEHNKNYGFTEIRFANLLFSESISVFLRNVELFRCCFLFVLKTRKRKKRRKGEKTKQYPFFHEMGIGQLLNALVHVCGGKGEKIKKKINCNLRNGLTHGLFWIDKLEVIYSTDITLSPAKRRQVKLDKLWMEAFKQSVITQCLIETIADWYEKSKIWRV